MKKDIYIRVLITIVGILIISLVVVILFFYIGQNSSKNNDDNQIIEEYKYSFQTMNNSFNELTEEQKNVARYFDNSYFQINSYTEILRYSELLKGLRISSLCNITSFISIDDDNYEALCVWVRNWEYGGYENSLSDEELAQQFVIRGKKIDKMFIEGDGVTLLGRLEGTKIVDIQGKNYNLPIISVEEITTDERFSEDTIRKVAKAVFGNDIKVRRPTEEEFSKMIENYYYFYSDSLYLIEIENTINNNFKTFDIWQSSNYGLISYNPLFNEGIESDYLNKKIFITPDLQKYIVFDMSRVDKYVYISVYDRSLKKLFSREIANVSAITWDATDTTLVFVSDNDMYQINLETGEDIVEPIFVGKKIRVFMVENGFILLSDSSDDTVMFMNKKGIIVNKFDIDINTFNKDNISVMIQELNNQYVVLYSYPTDISTFEMKTKYIILDH